MENDFKILEKRIDTIKSEMKKMKDVIKKVKEEFETKETKEIKLSWNLDKLKYLTPEEIEALLHKDKDNEEKI